MKVRGKTLNVFHYPNEGKPVIVLIHGLWGCIQQFQEQVEYFKEKYCLVAVESVGHGYSEFKPVVAEYKMESIVEDYLDVFAQLNLLKSRPVLVAHSYGAFVAKNLSAKMELSGIVFVAPLGYLDKEIVRKTQSILKRLPIWAIKSILWINNRKGEHSMGVNNSLGPNPTKAARELQWYVTEQNYQRPKVVALSLLGMEGVDVQDFEKVKCPALIISSTFDKTTPANEHAKKIHKCLQLPDDCFISYEAGHIIMLEEPQKVNEDIERFVGQLRI